MKTAVAANEWRILALACAVTAVAGCSTRPRTSRLEPPANKHLSELSARAQLAGQHAVRFGATLYRRQPPYMHTRADEQRGFVLYVPSMSEEVTDRVPRINEVTETVEMRMAPGQTTSVLLGVHALRHQADLAFAMNGAAPAGVDVEFLPVVMAPVSWRWSNQYANVGLWLARGGRVDIPARHSRAWLMRITARPDARPGTHRLQPVLRSSSGGGEQPGAEVRLSVLPIRLADPANRGYVFGVFCAGADFSEAQFREMKAHGIEAIQWFWGHYGLDVRNENGRLRMDFSELDRAMTRLKKAGLRGPIVLALGNDCCGHFERAICRAFDLPMQPMVKREGKIVKLAVLNNPDVERLMIDALRQLFDHAKEHRWPEIVILPYDEPTERLMDEHRRMVRLFRTAFPTVRLYGVAMNNIRYAEKVADTNIISTNGDWDRIIAFARAHKKSAWCYGHASAVAGYASNRWGYGLRPYAYHPDAMWFWSYNYYVGDPWNDFDGFCGDSDWVVCWPPVEQGGPSTETLAYEGVREAVSDVRYAMTLEAMLEKAKTGAADKIRRAYTTWLGKLRGTYPPPEQSIRCRDKLIDWILQLQKAGKAPARR